MATQSVPSPRFPFINLEKSLAKAQQLFNGDKSGKPMAVATAFELWGYSPKSSGGFQTTSALKMYGLIEDEGANDDRKVKLSSDARKYFLDERDEVRAGMLAAFALKPAIIRFLWENDKWRDGIPADTVARSHLKIERNFNDQSARALLSILKENIQFAGLKAGIVLDDALESVPEEVATGKPPQETAAPQMDQLQHREARPAAPLPVYTLAPTSAGEPAFQIVGRRVLISADLDLKGLRKLGKQLKLLESMLTMEDDDDEGEPSEPAKRSDGNFFE